MARSKKTELVFKTHELLKQYSPNDITIRMIADAADCTSTVIYRHFDNLQHLILVASVGFLEDYIIGLGDLLSNSKIDGLEMLKRMWDSFCTQAFTNVEVFELMFWGSDSDVLEEAIVQYYKIMPDKWQELNILFTLVFFNNDIEDRNLLIVKRAAAEGYFPEENLELFSSMQCSLFHGLLVEYRDVYRDPAKAAEGKNCYMKMLNFLIDSYRIK